MTVALRTLGTVSSAFLAALAFVLLTSVPGSAAAEEPDPGGASSWLVQPAGPLGGADTRSYFTYDLEPGEWVEDVVGITNHSEADLTLAVLGTDAFSDPETAGFALLSTAESPTDVGSWVTMAASEVTVPARSRMEVPFIVHIPENATPGDHAGGIVTSFVSAVTTDGGTQVLFDARIAVRIYLTVSGALSPVLAVDDVDSSFELSSNQLTGTLTVGYTVRNVGNLRLGAEELVRVRAPFGIGIDQAESRLDEVLPGGAVRRELIFDNVPAAVLLSVDVRVQPVDTVDSVRKLHLEPIEHAATLAAVPWAVLAGLVLVVGTSILIIRRRRAKWRSLTAQLARATVDRGRDLDV